MHVGVARLVNHWWVIAVDLRAWDASTWTSVAAWTTAAIYAALLLFAWRQVSEAKRLREEQARPFVVVDFDVDWLTELTIENVGRTIAHDVRLAFDPPLASTLSKPWPWEESTLFRSGIPTLVPGKRISVNFDSVISRFESDLPLAYRVEVSYRGYGKRRFEDAYVLDLGLYKGTTPPPKGIPEVVERLKGLHDEIKKWTDGIHGLQVNVTDRERKTRRDHRHIWVERATTVLKDEGWAAFVRHLGRRALQRRGWTR